MFIHVLYLSFGLAITRIINMKKLSLSFALLLPFAVNAGITDPDCTAEKAVKSAATKAAIGVGGRCNPAETAKDSAGKVIENALPDDGVAGKAVDKATGRNDTLKDKAADAVDEKVDEIVPDKLQKDNDGKNIKKTVKKKIE